jgi:hypothetical protein
VRFLKEAAPPRPLLSAILDDTLEHQQKQPDAVLFHDDLAEINEPLLFVEFIRRAGAHGLKFLSEADYPDMAVWKADSPAGRFLLEVGAENVVVQQQYRDFLIFRRFRQTLLCREAASRAPEPDPETLRSLYVAASTRPKAGIPDVGSDEPACFVSERDGEVVTPHPLSKAAFLELGILWPRWIPVTELLDAAAARVMAADGRSPAREDEARLLRFLLGSYGAGVAELRSTPCPFATRISERPRASALARLQSRSQVAVTNLRHQGVQLEDPLVRTFLRLLDGTRGLDAIGAEMARALREANPAAEALAADIEKGVALNFERVASLALLEG